ncbi:DinB family protein [uncultured Deinococcus sp.]|uniref:DinB family protein n=1 Tax=uncultured Deinococcus sp. TaxID=158789 RepID=UPI0025D40D32|nr:DinB family protein [uncultured Deinococcus sp.]
MTDLTLLLDSFRRNARVNAAVLAAVKPDEYDLTDGKGGQSVAQILRHMAGFRVGWLWNISREHAMPLLDPTQQDADGDPMWRWQGKAPDELADAFTEGDAAAVAAVQSALEEGRTFPDPWGEGTYQSSPAHFLQHTIVHDSHHRGQIMTLLREGGRTREEMDALDDHWAIWRE